MILNNLKEKISFKRLVLIIALVYVLSQLAAAVFVSESFLNTENLKESENASRFISTPLSSEDDMQWLNAESEKVSFLGGELSGVCLKNNSTSHSYVLIFHPLTANVDDMASYAAHFYELGFNVYIPDYVGESHSMGVFEQESVLKWAEFIAKNDETANIFIFGMGVGGAAVLLNADKSLPENVRGIISDSAYCDLSEVFKENIKNVYGVPAFPTVGLASLYTKLIKGWSFSQADVKNSVKNSSVPVLYIHGTEDSIVSVGQSNELYEVTDAEGTKHFTVYGADHAQSLYIDSEKYWRETDDFIRSAMDY